MIASAFNHSSRPDKSSGPLNPLGLADELGERLAEGEIDALADDEGDTLGLSLELGEIDDDGETEPLSDDDGLTEGDSEAEGL